MSNFKSNVKKGVFWNLTERLGNQLIRFALGIYLARLLTPEDYGLIALTTIIISISEIITDGGFLMTLIQKGNIIDTEYSTIFWLKLLIAGFLYGFIILFSDNFAHYFSEPELATILNSISIVIILSSLSSLHRIILMVKLDFKGQTKVVLTSTILGGIVGIFLAYDGYGVWSLVYQTITIHVIQIVLFWSYTKWFPKFQFSISFIKTVSRLSTGFLLNNILTVFYTNIYTVFFGKNYSSTDLGLYNRAKQFEQLPENTTNSVIVKVFFPILSKSKDVPDQLKENTLFVLGWLVYLITPIMLTLILLSDQIITILLTDKWIASSVFLKILCVAGILIPINNTFINILNVIGKPQLGNRIYIFKILFSTTMLVLLANYSVILASSIIIFENIIVFSILIFYMKRETNISLNDFFHKNALVFIVNASVFSLCYYLLPSIFAHLSPISQVIMNSICYLIPVYSLLYFFKSEQTRTINNHLKKLVNAK